MKEIKSIYFKSRVVSIEDGHVELRCGVNFPLEKADFDVEVGKEYEFELHGDGVHEYSVTLSPWITRIEYEEEGIK